jgi:hypothetical protein
MEAYPLAQASVRLNDCKNRGGIYYTRRVLMVITASIFTGEALLLYHPFNDPVLDSQPIVTTMPLISHPRSDLAVD